MHEKEKASSDAHHAGEARNHGEELALRKSALQARLNWRKANKLYEWVEEDRSRWDFLSRTDQGLVLNFDSGQLLKERQNADAAYGHGRDVDRLTLREIAILSAWSSDLAKYKESQ